MADGRVPLYAAFQDHLNMGRSPCGAGAVTHRAIIVKDAIISVETLAPAADFVAKDAVAAREGVVCCNNFGAKAVVT